MPAAADIRGTRFRNWRARYWYGALDAFYTAPTREDRPAAEFLREALRRASNFERVGSLTRWLEAHAPGWVRRLRSAVERLEGIPFRLEGAWPLGYGTRSTCIRLGGDPPRVLKFYRPSLGHDVAAIHRVARAERDSYETLGRWYAGIPHLLPHTIHLIIASPIRGAPAAAQIQELVDPDARDLLGDHSDEDLLALLRRHDAFRRHFRIFVEGTRRAWDEEGRFLDMVGRWNVLLIDGPEGPELRVADFGIWNLEYQRSIRPDLWERAAQAVARIERLAELAG